MKKLLLFIGILILIAAITPVHAQVVTINAPAGQAIWAVQFTAPPQSTGTIIIQQYNGDQKSGTFSYTGFPETATNVAFEGDTSTTNYILSGLTAPLYLELWNADNQTSGVRKVKLGYGQVKIGRTGIWNDYVEADIAKSPIKTLIFNSDQEVEINVDYIPESEANKKLSDDREQSILDLAWEVFFDAIDFGYALYYWLKFFFVDNLLMIVALFLAVPMAFAAKNSRGNPEKFLRQYFKSLKGFFEFVLSIWQRLIETIGTVRGWFRI